MFRTKKARFVASNTLTHRGFQPSKKPIVEVSYQAVLPIAKEKKGSHICRHACKALRHGDVELGLCTKGGQETQESTVQQHHLTQN